MHGSLPYPPNAAEMAAGARFPRGKMKKERKIFHSSVQIGLWAQPIGKFFAGAE